MICFSKSRIETEMSNDTFDWQRNDHNIRWYHLQRFSSFSLLKRKSSDTDLRFSFWKFELVLAYDWIDSCVLKPSSVSPFARYDCQSYDENERPIFAKIISRLVGIPQMMERKKPLQMNSPKELGCPSPLQRISILLYRLFVHTTSKKIKNKRRSQCLLALRCDEI